MLPLSLSQEMAFSKTFMPCLAVVLFLSMISFSYCREFYVGGRKGLWQVPSFPGQFNTWASIVRFQIGDSIVMKYDGKTDSVLEVTEEDYRTCNLSKPIKSYNDGNTRIVLDRSGSFFFISGAQGNCEKGQKLEIRVLSAKHSIAAAQSLSPSGYPHYSPAPAPGIHSGGSVLKARFVTGFVVAVISALV